MVFLLACLLVLDYLGITKLFESLPCLHVFEIFHFSRVCVLFVYNVLKFCLYLSIPMFSVCSCNILYHRAPVCQNVLLCIELDVKHCLLGETSQLSLLAIPAYAVMLCQF